MDPKRVEPGVTDLGAERWQLRMLPMMRGALVALAVFFFAASILQYRQLYEDIRQQSPSLKGALDAMEKGVPEAQRSTVEHVRWKTLVLLEQDAIRMRYQQVNATLLLRMWTRYTGFLVGMVLALVGAFFILGRLREEASQLSGESSGLKFSLATSSPGIILAVLGTVLMVITLLVKFEYTVTDRPVYLQAYVSSVEMMRPAMPPPKELTQGGTLAPASSEGFPQPPK